MDTVADDAAADIGEAVVSDVRLIGLMATPPLADDDISKFGMFKAAGDAPDPFCLGGGRGGPAPPAPGSDEGIRMTEFRGTVCGAPFGRDPGGCPEPIGAPNAAPFGG